MIALLQSVAFPRVHGSLRVAATLSGFALAEISRTIMAADATFLGPWGQGGAMTALSFFFVFGVGSLAQPHIAHKYLMARDVKQFKWYPMVMTVAMTLTLLLYLTVGVAVKALVVRGVIPPLARNDDAMPAFLLHVVPVAVAGVVFAGVAAAIMSTVNSFLSVGAAAIMHDLPQAMGRDPSNELMRGRVASVALALVAVFVAHAPGAQVAFLGVFGYGLFASTLVPALAIGLNWKGATARGACSPSPRPQVAEAFAESATSPPSSSGSADSTPRPPRAAAGGCPSAGTGRSRTS